MGLLTFDQLPDVISQLFKKVENIEFLLQSKADDSVEPDQLLNIADAAAFLSLRPPTIYGLVHKRKIPVCKQGKRLYFSKKELIEWIKTGRKKTICQIEEEAKKYIRSNPKRKEGKL